MADVLRGCFVAGTDTGVGKSLISAALLHILGNRGLRVAGLKPVAAGMMQVDGEWVNEDVALLHRASTVSATYAEIGPYQLQAACSPHIAAVSENRCVDLKVILEVAHRLQARGDGLVVEGVGGFRVPLGGDWDSADLACAFGLPVMLVVGMRLGCLNHALLTTDAILQRGLRCAGWIANVTDPEMLHLDENIQTLRQWLSPVPCLGVVSWQPFPEVSEIARQLDHKGLYGLFCSP